MASKNEVTLTFAGDHDKLTKSFDAVGTAARTMDTDVSTASRNAGEGFDRAGEAADNLDTKAMGFRDTMTGVQDTMLGASEIAKGNLFEGFFTLGMGIGDLGSGLYNFLIPSIKAASSGMISNALATGRATVAAGAHRVASLAGAAATGVMTVAQRALNLAMRANPIGIVITILAALGAAIVVAYRKSETFRNVVQAVWRGVRSAVSSTWEFLKRVFSWFTQLPGRIRGAFSTLASAISAPFRSAFGAIKGLWNATVGGFGFSVPSWVPGVGGKEFRIPSMHTGGIVPGAPGAEVLAVLQAGERVTPAGRAGGATVIEIRSGGSRLDELLVELLRHSIRTKGGNVQVVLGSP